MKKHTVFYLAGLLLPLYIGSAQAFPIFALPFAETQQSSPLSSPLSFVNIQAQPDAEGAAQPCKGGPGDADPIKGIGIGDTREQASEKCKSDVRSQLTDWRQECKNANCIPSITYQASASCNGGGPVTCTCIAHSPACLAR